MNFFQIIIGRYFLEIIGATARYFFLNTLAYIKGSEPESFSNIWAPKIGDDKRVANGMANHMIGVIIFMTVIVILVIVRLN